MRVGRGDAERLRVSKPPPHPSGLRPATFPPVGGRLWVCSNREGLSLLWDVWIHILGIGAECACWKAGGPVCRPYGGNVVSPGGAPCRVVCGRRAGEDTRPYGDCGRKAAGAQCAPLHGEEREPAPSSAPVCALGHLTLSPLAFGHLPLTRGVGPLWGEGLGSVQIGGNLVLCGTFGYIYW